MPPSQLTALDLVGLAEQLERDRALDWQALHRRDYQLGTQCREGDDAARLLDWLRALQATGHGRAAPEPMLSEQSIGMLAGAVLFLSGFAAMAGFLFASGDGTVNVLWFFAFFVLFPLLLVLFSALTLGAALLGRRTAGGRLNPARWLWARTMAGRPHWREFRELAQLVFLRYGQGMGMGFTLGALAGFLLVLAFNDFAFTWSSTFEISNGTLLAVADGVATPWSGWLPWATVDAGLVADSRYHALAQRFPPERLQALRGWWPFLLVSMLCYALLPRLLLWLLSRGAYRRRLRAAFVAYPGAALVLRRMSRPPVHTQGPGGAAAGPDAGGGAIPDSADGILLVDWSGALGSTDPGCFAELRGIGAERLVAAGLSSEADAAALARAGEPGTELVLLVVKSWEPPLSELADFVAALVAGSAAPCLVFLRPLDGEDVPAQRLEDWKRFSAAVPGGVQVKVMNAAGPDR